MLGWKLGKKLSSGNSRQVLQVVGFPHTFFKNEFLLLQNRLKLKNIILTRRGGSNGACPASLCSARWSDWRRAIFLARMWFSFKKYKKHQNVENFVLHERCRAQIMSERSCTWQDRFGRHRKALKGINTLKIMIYKLLKAW